MILQERQLFSFV